jgi:fumarate reductase flavoprotein subunit
LTVSEEFFRRRSKLTSSVRWDEEFDVVVAGGGGAGLMAAVEAAELGATVLLVEKQPRLGGATEMSIGSITAACTALQAVAGIRDDVEAHYRDLLEIMQSAGQDNAFDLELSHLMIELAPRAVARLTELGIEFSGPHPEPPHTVYRMHNAVPDASAYIDVLSATAAERGVEIRTETAMQELQRDDAGGGATVGLRHAGDNQTRTVRVRRGVVLAAGDFSANDELARTYGRPPEISRIDPMRPYATGDGVLLATANGAATAGMHRTGYPYFRTTLPPHCAPNRQLFLEGAILVNKLGRRFTNELGEAAFATNQQPEKIAYIMFDSRLADRIATAADDSIEARDGWYRNNTLYLCTFPGVAYAYLDDLRQNTEYFFEANSAEQLADRLQLPTEDFKQELRTFNRAVQGLLDDPFGRHPTGPGISDPPFYAFGPVKPVLVFSGGGVKVDRDMHVLDQAGRVVPHLYACGANAEAGVFLGGHGHHLAWVFGTAQIAGRNAATD